MAGEPKRLEFGQREPLTTRLHGLVRSYPRGVGILHEFIQNADDAGATELWFVLDERHHPETPLPSREMATLQGPAIVVYNNAVFSDEDWERIQEIGLSGKSLDTSKTGRFGLGFNSVYNVTDWPCIVTRQKIGIFDPHENVVLGASSSNPGSAWQLEEAQDAWPALLAPFEFLPQKSHTVFRLPLRTDIQATRSKISSQPFTSGDFSRIVQKASEEAGELLLFQKNLLHVRVSRIARDNSLEDVLIIRTINCERVRDGRRLVYDNLLADPLKTLEALQMDMRSVVSQFDHNIEVTCPSKAQESQTWLVVNGLFVDSENKLIDAAQKMIELGEKAVPLAGAAALVNPPSKNPSQGRLFCGLPLASVQSGMACHIQGFFDLQSDRQGIFVDTGAIGNDATRVEWNRVLLAHACADAAAHLFTELARRSLNEAKEPYGSWPTVPANPNNLIDELPAHVYGALARFECIAAGKPLVWLKPADVQNVSRAAKRLRDPLLADGLSIPDPLLPAAVVSGFETSGAPLRELTPEFMRDYLRVNHDPACHLSKAPRQCLMDRNWIIDLLTYCTSDKKLDELCGVPLALMQDGMLRAFGKVGDVSILLGSPQSRHLFAEKTSWFIDDEIEKLQTLSESLKAGIEQLSPQGLIKLLPRILTPIDQDKGANWNTPREGIPTSEWLADLFEYLAENKEKCSLKQQSLRSLPLVPDQFNRIWGMGHSKTPLLTSVANTSTGLIQALKAFRIPVVSADEELTKKIRKLEKAFPDQAIRQLTARDLVDTLVAVEDDWDEATAKFSSDVHTPILDFLASKASLTDLGGRAKDRIEDLCQLPIFPLASGTLTSLDRDDVFLANDFEVPPLRIELGVLDSGQDGKWKPLYDQLGIQRLSKNRLIKSVVVPRYSSLTKDDQLTALRWMRTHLQPALDELEKEPEEARKTFGDFLRISKLIHSSDGVLRAPEDVYPPDASFVQGLLGELAGFPDMSTYRDDPGRWLAFFRELGAPQAISARALLRGVDRVIEDRQSNSTESTKTLQRIADYLEGHWPDLRDQRIDDDRLQTKQPWTLLESLQVRAWLPALQEPPATYPLALFESPSKHLFKPGELYVRDSLELVGTSCPVCSIPRLVSLRDDLGITQHPDLKLVFEHFEQVLEYYQKSECSEEDRKAAHRVIERIYRFFGSKFGSRETVTPKEEQEAHAIKSWSVDRRCILDADGKLWRPSDVFREATAFFLGLRGQARSKSDDVDHGLEVLGRRESPEVFDFREFFDELTRIQGGRSVAPDQLDKIREAYNRASNLDDSKSALRGSQVLTDALVLAEHTDIVLDDAPWWNERAKRAGICFLDHKLQPAVADAFGVASLSKALSEEIVEASDTTCSQFRDRCNVLQRRIRSNEFGCGLLRILRSQCLTAEAQGLDWLKETRIRPVDRLITTLCWVDESEDISGSEGESDVLIHPTENALVVSVLASDILYQRVAAVIQQELARKNVRLADLTPLVSILGEEPGGIDTLLDRLRVPKLLQSNLATIPTDTENEPFIDSEEVAEKLTESASTATGQGVGVTQDSEQIIHSSKSGPFTKTTNEQSSDGTYRSVENQVDVGSQDRGATVADSNNANAHEEQGTVRAGNPNASDKDHHHPLSPVGKPPVGSSTSSGLPKRDAVSEEPQQQQDTGGALHGAAGGTKGAGERDQGQSGLAKGPPASNKSRSSAGSSKGQRARTYVENRKDGKDQGGAKDDSSKRTDVERAAVERVLAYERQRGQQAKEMSHTNPGYDIESRPPRGEIERYIEVKGLAGAWTDWGVGLSPEQIRHGQREGMRFWLYVVEFALEPARSKIFAIQDPYALIDEFRFDDGWKLLAKEQDGPGTGALPTVGATIVLGTGKKGTIRGVRKQGAFFLLNIKMEGEAQPYNCVYQPATMQIVSVEEPK